MYGKNYMYINRARQGYTEPSEKSKQEKLRKRKEKGHTDKQTTTSKKTKEMNNTSSLVAQQQRRQRQKYKQTIIIITTFHSCWLSIEIAFVYPLYSLDVTTKRTRVLVSRVIKVWLEKNDNKLLHFFSFS